MSRHPHDRRARGTLHRAKMLSLAAALLVGCGGGSEVLLVPFFTFGFAFQGAINGANRDIFLNLTPFEPTTASGALQADSTLRIDNDRRTVTGSYSGCTLTLAVGQFDPASGGSASNLMAGAYNGRFTGPNTLQLTPVSGPQPVLTLTRGGADPRPTTC